MILGTENRSGHASTMDPELRLLLRGIRAVLVVGVAPLLALVVAAGPRLRKGPLPYGKGGCFETASEIVCAYP